MNDYSYKTDNKGKNYTLYIIIGSIVLLAISALLLTNYKQETLICSQEKNSCVIENTNLLNMKNKKEITKFSSVQKLYFEPIKIRGNRYAKGYTAYHLNFRLTNGEKIRIFKTAYYIDEKNDAREGIKNLNLNLKTSGEIILDRNP